MGHRSFCIACKVSELQVELRKESNKRNVPSTSYRHMYCDLLNYELAFTSVVHTNSTDLGRVHFRVSGDLLKS